jgi:release factor glutamine methyltransferase
MKFFVNENVLIPRPETEELVEWVVEDARGKKYDVRSKKNINIVHPTSAIVHILDIGTGSGCIAIALKKELNADIIAVDISARALSVAKRNADDQNVKIDLLQLNFLDNSNWDKLPVFDIIVSNPPYIPEKEKGSLEKNVVDYEPHLALFVSDDDPLIFYRKMGEFSLNHLSASGKIYVELNEKHAGEVQKIFSQYNFRSVIRKDIYGRERMICAVR